MHCRQFESQTTTTNNRNIWKKHKIIVNVIQLIFPIISQYRNNVFSSGMHKLRIEMFMQAIS